MTVYIPFGDLLNKVLFGWIEEADWTFETDQRWFGEGDDGYFYVPVETYPHDRWVRFVWWKPRHQWYFWRSRKAKTIVMLQCDPDPVDP